MSKDLISTDTPCMNRILAALKEHGPLDNVSLAKHAHISERTLRNGNYQRLLMAARLIHIDSWARHPRGGNPTKIYAAGPGVNAKRPKPICVNLLARLWRVRSGHAEALKAARRLRKPPCAVLAVLLNQQVSTP